MDIHGVPLTLHSHRKRIRHGCGTRLDICISSSINYLMLRKKDMKPALKYGIIAAAWIVYLIIGLSGNSNDNTATTGNNTETIVSENETINDDVTTNIVESQNR